VLHAGLVGVLYSAVLTSSLLAVGLSAYCFSKVSFSLERVLFWRMARYSIPVTLTGLALFVIHYGDRFILQRFVSLADIGVYAIAYKIGMTISNLHSSFQSYWTAQMFELLRGRKGEHLFTSVFTYMCLFLAVAGLALSVFSGPVLTIITAPGYWGARTLIPYIVGAYIFRAMGDYFRGVFYTENRPDLDARLNWMGAVVCLAGYFGLIPVFKVWGAIAATVLAFGFVAGMGFRWINRLRRLEVEFGRLAKIGAAAAAVLLASHFAPATPLLANILLNGLAFGLFPLVLWILRFATESERETLVSACGSAVQRLRVACQSV
jgi:O-antigen/teichoic acid export membrane protein